MLSRVAERMYWLGRYAERAENTARLLSVNTNLAMDLKKVKFIWASLIEITGNVQKFSARYTVQNERNAVKFLLSDRESSIRTCIALARENVRTSREILPNETWEKINDLHLMLTKDAGGLSSVDGRQKFLKRIVNRCHELTGYLAGTMSENDAYSFIRIGRNLERADMSTRILDVGCFNLMNPDHPELAEHQNILWMNVLKSMTGYQMYRQTVQHRVNGEDVVKFVILDGAFPRSVNHCLNVLESCFQRLPNNEDPLRAATHAQRMLASADMAVLLTDDKLHAYIDEMQVDLAEIHDNVCQTWFGGRQSNHND